MSSIDDLRALAALREKATPGPWESDEGRPYNSGLDPIDEGEWPSFAIPSPDPHSGREWWIHLLFSDDPSADAAFIAAAGSFDFAALLAELDAAREMAVRLPLNAMRCTTCGKRLDSLGDCDSCTFDEGERMREDAP